jgi:hypothetical protein
MKIVWRVLFAFFIPANLAILCIFANHLIMNGATNCRDSDAINFGERCADKITLLFSDFFVYSFIGLFFLSFFLPVIFILRNRKSHQIKLFD